MNYVTLISKWSASLFAQFSLVRSNVSVALATEVIRRFRHVIGHINAWNATAATEIIQWKSIHVFFCELDLTTSHTKLLQIYECVKYSLVWSSLCFLGDNLDMAGASRGIIQPSIGYEEQHLALEIHFTLQLHSDHSETFRDHLGVVAARRQAVDQVH